jgi:two-component system NarL family sensor kinase
MSTSFLVIIGSAVFLFLAISVIIVILVHQKSRMANKVIIKEKENLHQKKLVEASIEVAEIEREKIAKDIHDDVGSALNVIIANIKRIEKNEDDKILTRELITESKALIESTIESIRSISRDLMPPVLIRLGYEKGLKEFCRQINISGIINVVFIPYPEEFILSKRIELQLYRIVQEVMNNIIKHANASEVKITLTRGTLYYTTVIAHNGKGITSEMINKLSESKGGVGLRSIQSRAQMINATVQYIILGDIESKITIEIPINETAN